MNKQSNLYTVIYATVLVLAVGIGLSLVYQSLKTRQAENAANDTRRQILASAHITIPKGSSVADVYKQHITEAFIVNTLGERIDANEDALSVKVANEVKMPASERKLPVFVCDTDNGTKYIVPVAGDGLWGPIWGYVCFDDNGDTIYGAYFAHQGETPGLGAEIEKPAFSDKFIGKDVFAPNGSFQSVKVVKKGAEPKEGAWVNGISGGTITSNGVSAMLRNSLEPYSSFLRSLAKKPQQPHIDRTAIK